MQGWGRSVKLQVDLSLNTNFEITSYKKLGIYNVVALFPFSKHTTYRVKGPNDKAIDLDSIYSELNLKESNTSILGFKRLNNKNGSTVLERITFDCAFRKFYFLVPTGI